MLLFWLQREREREVEKRRALYNWLYTELGILAVCLLGLPGSFLPVVIFGSVFSVEAFFHSFITIVLCLESCTSGGVCEMPLQLITERRGNKRRDWIFDDRRTGSTTCSNPRVVDTARHTSSWVPQAFLVTASSHLSD